MRNIIGEGIDYASGPYSVTIPAGEMSIVFDVLINDDNVLEETEIFNLVINTSSLPSRVVATNPDQASVTIVDNDGKSSLINKFGS